MQISVGIDVGRERHWVIAIDGDGIVRLGGITENTPAAIAGLAAELDLIGGTVCIGLDVVGGDANLLEAGLAEAGFTVVRLSETAARAADSDGDRKPEIDRARAIARQVQARFGEGSGLRQRLVRLWARLTGR